MNRAKLKFTNINTTTSRVSVRNINESAEDQPYLTQHFTVSDITDSTYGNVETITPQTLKKIQKLRLLLQTHAITEEEYVALVDSYLHGDKQQK